MNDAVGFIVLTATLNPGFHYNIFNTFCPFSIKDYLINVQMISTCHLMLDLEDLSLVFSG